MKMLSSIEEIGFVLTGFTVIFQMTQKAVKVALAGKLEELIVYALPLGNSVQF